MRRTPWMIPLALAALALLPVSAQARAGDAALLSALARAQEARAQALVSVRSDVVVELASPTWNAGGTCQGKVAARRPGALRLVGYAAVATVFDAATDGARFQVVIPPQGKAWVGEAKDEAALVGLPIRPGDVVAALFGEPYGAAVGPRRVLAGGNSPTIAWTLDDGHEVRTRYDAARWLPQRAELWQDGAMVARLSYHDYRRLSGTWWPTRIDFDWPGEKGHLALTFDHPHFNAALSDSLFAPRLPRGLDVVDAGAPPPDAGRP